MSDIEGPILRMVFPWPPSSITPHAKGGWRKKASATKVYRTTSFWIAKEAGVTLNPSALLVVTYNPPNLRADVQNMHGRVKAVIDGIADAMGCDDKKFRVAFPDSWGEVKKQGEVVVCVARSVGDVVKFLEDMG